VRGCCVPHRVGHRRLRTSCERRCIVCCSNALRSSVCLSVHPSICLSVGFSFVLLEENPNPLGVFHDDDAMIDAGSGFALLSTMMALAPCQTESEIPDESMRTPFFLSTPTRETSANICLGLLIFLLACFSLQAEAHKIRKQAKEINQRNTIIGLSIESNNNKEPSKSSTVSIKPRESTKQEKNNDRPVHRTSRVVVSFLLLPRFDSERGLGWSMDSAVCVRPSA